MFIKKDVNEMEYRDTAMALVLICLLLMFVLKHDIFLYLGIGILFVAMVIPRIMRYPAMLWFGFSHLLGMVMSRVILGVVFMILVIPVGLARRLLGKDSMRLKHWKQSSDSVYVIRDHIYVKEDLENQF